MFAVIFYVGLFADFNTQAVVHFDPGAKAISLPLELIGEVAKGMRKHDLTVLARTCRVYRIIAQKAMFRNIVLDSTRSKVFMRFVACLETQPGLERRLHCYVNTIHLTVANTSLERAWYWTAHLIREVRWMANLKSLTWSTHRWAPAINVGPSSGSGAIAQKLPKSCKELLFYNAEAKESKALSLTLLTTNSESHWVMWWALLPKSITLVTFVTIYSLFHNGDACSIVYSWLHNAPKTLRRVEFWSNIKHVQFTDDAHLGRVWIEKKGDAVDAKEIRAKYAFRRSADNEAWEMLKEGKMQSGPQVEIITCLC